MNPTVKTGTALLLLLALLLTQSGCTAMLWDDENSYSFRQPAPDPDLHVYQSANKNDYLVVYREQSDTSDRIRTRAYWLNKNRMRVTRDLSPVFVSQSASLNLPAIPVFNSLPPNAETNKTMYAVYSANLLSFALFSTNRQVGAYALPAYNTGRPVAEKIALTPFTVATDAAILAGIAGLLFLCFQNNCN